MNMATKMPRDDRGKYDLHGYFLSNAPPPTRWTMMLTQPANLEANTLAPFWSICCRFPAITRAVIWARAARNSYLTMYSHLQRLVRVAENIEIQLHYAAVPVGWVALCGFVGWVEGGWCFEPLGGGNGVTSVFLGKERYSTSAGNCVSFYQCSWYLLSREIHIHIHILRRGIVSIWYLTTVCWLANCYDCH